MNYSKKPQLATLLKKRLRHMCFSVNFAKFLRTPFLTEHLRPVAASEADLNVSDDIGLSENLIQLNPSKSKSRKIPVFNRINKSIWLEKRTAIENFRSSHRRCSVRKGVFSNFAKFTGKHLRESLFFNKVAG